MICISTEEGYKLCAFVHICVIPFKPVQLIPYTTSTSFSGLSSVVVFRIRYEHVLLWVGPASGCYARLRLIKRVRCISHIPPLLTDKGVCVLRLSTRITPNLILWHYGVFGEFITIKFVVLYTTVVISPILYVYMRSCTMTGVNDP